MGSALIGLAGKGLNVNKYSLTGGSFAYNWKSSQGYAWYQRVLAAGADISPLNQPVFDTAFQSIYSNSTISGAIAQTGFLIGFKDGSGGAGSAINGCFVPIVGNTPINHGFVSSDFNPLRGLLGDGSKYIDLNRRNGVDGNNKHIQVGYYQRVGSQALMGSGINTGDSILLSSGNPNAALSSLTSPSFVRNVSTTNFSSFGLNRDNSVTQVRAYSGTGTGSATQYADSYSPASNSPTYLFADPSFTYSNFSGYIFYYSMGTSMGGSGQGLIALAGIMNTLALGLT